MAVSWRAMAALLRAIALLVATVSASCAAGPDPRACQRDTQLSAHATASRDVEYDLPRGLCFAGRNAAVLSGGPDDHRALGFSTIVRGAAVGRNCRLGDTRGDEMRQLRRRLPRGAGNLRCRPGASHQPGRGTAGWPLAQGSEWLGAAEVYRGSDRSLLRPTHRSASARGFTGCPGERSRTPRRERRGLHRRICLRFGPRHEGSMKTRSQVGAPLLLLWVAGCAGSHAVAPAASAKCRSDPTCFGSPLPRWSPTCVARRGCTDRVKRPLAVCPPATVSAAAAVGRYVAAPTSFAFPVVLRGRLATRPWCEWKSKYENPPGSCGPPCGATLALVPALDERRAATRSRARFLGTKAATKPGLRKTSNGSAATEWARQPTACDGPVRAK